jgi:hypothetical protein
LLFEPRVARANEALEAQVSARLRSLGASPLGLFLTGASVRD